MVLKHAQVGPSVFWFVAWGDEKSKHTKSDSQMRLGEARALQHGAKSPAFFKSTGKKDPDW